jgi:hypothetical protein
VGGAEGMVGRMWGRRVGHLLVCLLFVSGFVRSISARDEFAPPRRLLGGAQLNGARVVVLHVDGTLVCNLELPDRVA